jgi:hypothetical protein
MAKQREKGELNLATYQCLRARPEADSNTPLPGTITTREVFEAAMLVRAI